MSFYLATITKDTAVLAYDCRRIIFEKREDKVEHRVADIFTPKFHKINGFSYFLGPAISNVDDGLAKFLMDHFGEKPIDLKNFIAHGSQFLKKAKSIITEKTIEAQDYFGKLGIRKEDFDPGFFIPDCVLGGIDTQRKPFLITFQGEDFGFEVLTESGDAVATRLPNEPMQEWLNEKIVSLQKFLVTTSKFSSLLPDIVKRFTEIFAYVAAHDSDVSQEFDLILVDRDGSKQFLKGTHGVGGLIGLAIRYIQANWVR